MVRLRMLACLAAVLACRGEPQSAGEPATSVAGPTPTSTPTSSSASSTPTSAPASPAPAPIPLSRAAAIEPAGPAPLSRDAETVVDPASSFQVELSGRVADARLVLLDSADAHVPARGTREVGASTRLTLAPASPLASGSRYVLRVEGASAGEIRDGDRTYAPDAFALLAAGTPAPPEPKKKAKRSRRQR